jgi:hypothetical protein
MKESYEEDLERISFPSSALYANWLKQVASQGGTCDGFLFT